MYITISLKFSIPKLNVQSLKTVLPPFLLPQKTHRHMKMEKLCYTNLKTHRVP